MSAALNHTATLTSAWRRSGSAVALAAGGLLLLWGCAGCGAEPAKVVSGGVAALDEWRGSWLVINYWAEWCEPCRDEIPELNALHHTQPEVAVVGVNFDGVSGDKLNALIARMGIEFPVLTSDPRPRWGYDPPGALPMTVLIRPDSVLHKRLLGPQTQETLLAAMQ